MTKVEKSEQQISRPLGAGTYKHIDDHVILNWAVKTRSLIASACGKDSDHYTSFVKAEEVQSFDDNPTRLKRLSAVFFAAREDFEGGYLHSVRNLVQAEIAGAEMDQAKTLLSSGYMTAAAIVAGVVLETALRSLCEKRGLSTSGMERMNADLAKAGEYNALVQKRVTALAAVRNSAAHGKTSEYTNEDVKSMTSEVERFVAEHLP